AAGDRLSMAVIKQFPDDKYVADAVIASLQDKEGAFLKQLLVFNPDTSLLVNKRLRKVIYDMSNATNKKKAKLLEKELPKGIALFNSVCQTCHGPDGNGIRSLAPPLNRSEWVTGDKNKLIPIVLFGLTGPVKINGTTYQPPEITGDMPGIGNNA